MRKKGYKGRCEKRIFNKCDGICRTYDQIQYAYSEILQNDNEISKIQYNVLMKLDEGEYTCDFLCTKTNGDLMVRECIFRNHLTKPMTVKLLDASREYWLKHGVTDWGLIIDGEK